MNAWRFSRAGTPHYKAERTLIRVFHSSTTEGIMTKLVLAQGDAGKAGFLGEDIGLKREARFLRAPRDQPEDIVWKGLRAIGSRWFVWACRMRMEATDDAGFARSQRPHQVELPLRIEQEAARRILGHIRRFVQGRHAPTALGADPLDQPAAFKRKGTR